MSDSGRRGPDPDVRAEKPFPAEVEHSLRVALQDRYVIEREIGRGGMGVVFRARDLKHDRTVAIKALRPDIARYRGSSRFLTEIRTAARLTHPHIVTVFDSGEVDGLMYYVMPFVEGESLRGLLQRTGKLEPAVAVKIASQIASALQYAHDLGVVHRDIKPENILLADGHAWLADFGVARALAGDGDLNLTATGQLLGSPLYASPEHSGAPGDIDGRTDIYSLGCVLYEMITGSPPFTGKTLQAVLMRHHTEKPGSLTRVRPNIPAALDDVVQTALAKRPEQRFANAAGFEAALSRTIDGGQTVVWRPRISRKLVGIVASIGGLLMVGTVAILWLQPAPTNRQASGTNPLLDTALYVVMPISSGLQIGDLHAEDRIGQGLRNWIGVDVIDPSLVAPGDTNAARLARRTRAGRIIRARVTSFADSYRVYVELEDGNRPGVKLDKITRSLAMRTEKIQDTFSEIADALMLRGIEPRCTAGNPGTRILSAVHACNAAFSALYDGQLLRADSMFQRALKTDNGYSRAALWLAEIRGWIVEPRPDTRALTNLALADTNGLTMRERAFVRAQIALAGREYARACSIYRDVIATDARDHVAWLGLGECHRRDDIVIRDSRSATKWAFRSSYHQAVQAYRRAFELEPALIGLYRDQGFEPVRELLMTAMTTNRRGRTIDSDSLTFSGLPAWHRDSLQVIAVPTRMLSDGNTPVVPASIASAVDRQRDLLIALANRWSQLFPTSSAAEEALAIGLELTGSERALFAVRRALAIAITAEDSFRLAVKEAELTVKFSLPDRIEGLRHARRLAESIIAANSDPSPERARSLVSLAVLLGRPALAAQLSRKGSSIAAPFPDLPAGMLPDAHALRVFTAVGAYPDSMSHLVATLDRAVQNLVAPTEQAAIRRSIFARSVLLAFPAVQLPVLKSIGAGGAYSAAALAFERGDNTESRAILARIPATRAPIRPADITLDALYVEAWLLNKLGDPRTAVSRLDPTIEAIRFFPPGRLQDVGHLGGLLRAMMLRAELAADLGDLRQSKRWSAPIVALWTKPEEELKQTYMLAQRLSRN